MTGQADTAGQLAPVAAAHLAGRGDLGVQPADEGPNPGGKRVFKNRQFGL